MVRMSLAAAVLLATHVWLQDMPVTRLAGDGPGRVTPQTLAPPAPRPAGTPLPPLPVTQLDQRDSAATLDSPRRLTLTFADSQPIGDVLQLLVHGTPFSLAMDPDATGTFRGELKQLTLPDALTTLLVPLGLEFHVQGTVIRIRRQQAEMRQYDLNLLNVQRGVRVDAGASADPLAGRTLTTIVPPDDVFAAIADGVQMLLSSTGRVHVDRRAGLAQVTDFPDRLDRVGLYIETLHQRSGRQVRLQAQVFEVTLKDAMSIDSRVVREKLGLPPDAPAAGLAADPVALRTVLAAQGEIRPLWAPDVTTLNNEPARLRVATPGGVSLTMIVVPQVSADGIVQLSVSHSWEEHAGDRRQGFMKSMPVMRVSESDTVTRVMDGNTAIIAGLLRPQPIATTAAGVAGLFGAQTKKPGYAELVVLLRPTVVTPGAFSTGSRP
jgi:type II secretory pathway component HofQ